MTGAGQRKKEKKVMFAQGNTAESARRSVSNPVSITLTLDDDDETRPGFVYNCRACFLYMYMFSLPFFAQFTF